MSPVTIRLEAQFGTPYPRSTDFDTDIGAFIESSTVPSSKGLMAPSIVNNDAVQGEATQVTKYEEQAEHQLDRKSQATVGVKTGGSRVGGPELCI